MKRPVAWLLLSLLCVAFAAAVFVALRAQARAGKGMPEYSVYSDDRNGLAKTAQVLRRLGFTPVAVQRPVNPDRQHGLLFVVEPEGEGGLFSKGKPDMSRDDARFLLRWVERGGNAEDGNTLVLCGRRTTALHRELHVKIHADEKAAKSGNVMSVALADAGGYTEGIDMLEVEGHDVVESEGGLPLWFIGDQPGAVLLRRGNGQVLIVPDASLFTHRGLLRAGKENVLFLYNLAALDSIDGQVYFDEYHHGLRSGGGLWGFLYYYDQHWIILQVLLVAVVAGWSLAIRLGPAVPAPKARQADAVDYASAVARIYQRTGVHDLLAKALARDFLAALCRHLRLRKALPAEILKSWRAQYPEQPAAKADGQPPVTSRTGDSVLGRKSAASATEWLRDLLRGVVELRRGEVSESQLLGWVREFDRFKSEVLSGR
jgi:hypothetical protein